MVLKREADNFNRFNGLYVNKQMLHSYVRVWIHLIWTTKNRKRILIPKICLVIHKHIIEYAAKSVVSIESLNIQPEHVHCLFNLLSNEKIEDIVKSLKGESSHWINEEKLLSGYFSWQRGYDAFSVSASQLEKVKAYIRNQDEHHRRLSFKEEYEAFLIKYGFTL